MTERSDSEHTIDLSVEVPGTPEQVWEAIATGPGITSWFVPHDFDGAVGARVRVDFGGGLAGSATVTTWEPPHRLVFKRDGDQALAYEWLVEARDGGSCVIRLVCTGFGAGDDWETEFNGQTEGWRLFLQNLRLHLTHFGGQHARAIIPTAFVTGTRDRAFEALCSALGVPADLADGDPFEASVPGGPPLTGQVARTTTTGARAYQLVLQSPAPGTAILSAEGGGDQVALGLWLYLYGPDAGLDTDAFGSFLTGVGERLAPTA